MSKIKRFPSEVSIGDKVQLCANWRHLVKRYRKSDGCKILTGISNTVLVDDVAKTRTAATYWVTLVCHTYKVRSLHNQGELLELHCEETGRIAWVSRLMLK